MKKSYSSTMVKSILFHSVLPVHFCVFSGGSHNFIKKGVVICTETTLKGSCLEISEAGMYDYPLKGWNDAIGSIYVSGKVRFFFD